MGYRFRWLAFILYLCVTILTWSAMALATPAVPPEQARPRAVVDNPVAEIEGVAEGATIEHTFVLRNTGDAELKITDVKTGWGCAAADFERQIPPGGEGRITLKVSTKGYEGALVKSARVYTNDPDQKELRLTIKARIQALVSVAPKYVLLKPKNGESASQTIEIEASVPKPLTLELSDSGLNDQVTYTLEETRKGRAFRILIVSRADLTQDAMGTLLVRTNYPEKPEIRIPIRVRQDKGETPAPQRRPPQRRQGVE